MLVDPNQVWYTKDWLEVKTLKQIVWFYVPDDVRDYKNRYDKYFSDLGFAIAVVSRGIAKDSRFKQIMTGIGWGAFYSVKQDKGHAHAWFFLRLLDSEIFMRIFNF